MRARVISLVILLVAVAAGAAPGVARANFSAKKAIWGPVTVGGKSEFPVYHRLGVGIYEMGLNWRKVAWRQPRHPSNPRDPRYRWPAEVTYAIHQAARYHMRVLLQVIFTPRWANGRRSGSHPPIHVRALAQFLTAAARRYPSVHLWMIWGEPDRAGSFALTRHVPITATHLTPAEARAPHVYAQMLDASYGALKAVSRRNLVIGGNTYTWGNISTHQWIKNLRLPNGRPPRMDLYGHNPFCFRAPNLSDPLSGHGAYDFSDVARLSRLVNTNLARPGHRLKLFLAEWTIPTSRFDPEFNFWVLPRVGVQWIRDAFRIVHRSSFIYALGWIPLFDGRGRHGISGGLFTARGRPTPFYRAFKNG